MLNTTQNAQRMARALAQVAHTLDVLCGSVGMSPRDVLHIGVHFEAGLAPSVRVEVQLRAAVWHLFACLYPAPVRLTEDSARQWCVVGEGVDAYHLDSGCVWAEDAPRPDLNGLVLHVTALEGMA